MKKYFLLIIIAIITITSCEKDNICVDPITPNLIIQFYDYEHPKELKKVSDLTVWVKDKEPLFTNQTTDSIAIPLDLNHNFTLYKLMSNTVEDEINFIYSRSDVFVGRSCGYKTVYKELEIEHNTNNWIKDIEIINHNIENETAAQIHIFH
jgi:hypothetical protein